MSSLFRPDYVTAIEQGLVYEIEKMGVPGSVQVESEYLFERSSTIEFFNVRI